MVWAFFYRKTISIHQVFASRALTRTPFVNFRVEHNVCTNVCTKYKIDLSPRNFVGHFSGLHVEAEIELEALAEAGAGAGPGPGKQETDNRKHETGNRKQQTGNRKQETENRKQERGN